MLLKNMTFAVLRKNLVTRQGQKDDVSLQCLVALSQQLVPTAQKSTVPLWQREAARLELGSDRTKT